MCKFEGHMGWGRSSRVLTRTHYQFTSQNAKKISLINGKDVATQFLDDAKKLLDSEKGRASIPTVQGLLLLFTMSAYRGADRAGMV